MKINSNQIYISFKSTNNNFTQPLHTAGIDVGTCQMRKDIRKHFEESHIPQLRLYELGGRMSEWQLNKTRSDLVRKPVIIDDNKMDQVDLTNLTQCSDNIYRGAMITREGLFQVQKLKDAGINAIIAVDAGTLSLRDECKKVGIKFRMISFEDKYNDAFKTWEDTKAGLYGRYTQEELEEHREFWKSNSRDFIDKFVAYIQSMQKDNVYIGCELGTYHTDKALLFDYLFNPKCEHRSYMKRSYSYMLDYAQNLYDKLTPEDKAKMGWDKEFEKKFVSNLKSLQEQYD